MKPAENINDLVKNLDPAIALSPQDHKDTYVPIPDYERILDILRDDILNDESSSQTLWVAGQSGTGKTSALNFLPNQELETAFHIKFIPALDLFDANDFDIIDLLLMFAFKLVQDTDLEDQYYEELNRLQKLHDGILTEENLAQADRKASLGSNGELSAGGGFLDFVKLKFKFFAKYQLDRLHRHKAREVFQLKKSELLDLVNRIVLNYRMKVAEEKKLLVIFDDLDKLRDLNQIRSIFIDNRNFLTNIRCKKVIAIPIHLSGDPQMTALTTDIHQFGLTLEPNPLDQFNTSCDELLAERKQIMRDIVSRRMAPGADLIQGEAIEEAIRFSGGLLRQYMQLLQMAAKEARRGKSPRVTLDFLKNACQTQRNHRERSIRSGEKVHFLHQTSKLKTLVEGSAALATEALLGNQIIAYCNGTVWYDVNPLIERAVTIYAKRQNET